MKYTTLIFVILTNAITGCSVLPADARSYCDGKISGDKASNLLQRNRGFQNGAQDTNRDGRVDYHESFGQWDFWQIEMVLQQGTEHKEYFWTNIDTCYTFHTVAGDFFEDKSKGVLYESACRKFTVKVYNDKDQYLGMEQNQACRNFGTHKWEIY